MHVHTTRLPSLRTLGLLIFFLFTNTIAAVPAPGLRLVDAIAARDTALVRALMEDGVEGEMMQQIIPAGFGVLLTI